MSGSALSCNRRELLPHQIDRDTVERGAAVEYPRGGPLERIQHREESCGGAVYSGLSRPTIEPTEQELSSLE